MKFINKNTGNEIDQNTWLQLSEIGKSNFVQVRDTIVTTHQIIETKSDSLSVGDAAVVLALAPVAIIASIFDF